MRSLPIAAACGLLLFAGASVAASPARADLLARLQAAQPPKAEGLLFVELRALVRGDALRQANPGREAQLAPLLDDFALGARRLITDEAVLAASMRQVDTSLTGDEISHVIAVYESPAYRRMFSGGSSDEAMATAIALMEDPVFEKFTDAAMAGTMALLDSRPVSDGMAACDDALFKGAERAGLKVT